MNEDITSRAEDVDDNMFAISSSAQRRIQTESNMCREDGIISDDDSSTSSCASIDTNVLSRDIDEDDEELGAPRFSPKGKFLHYERREYDEDNIPAIMQTHDIDEDEVSCQPKTMASKIRKNKRICMLLISLLVISFAVVTAIAFFSGELFGENNKRNESKLQLPSASSMITDETSKHTHPKYPNHEHPKHTHEPDHKHTHHHPQKEDEEHTHPLKEHACRNCDVEEKHTHTHPKKEHSCRGNCTSIDDTSDSDTVSVRPFKQGEEEVVPWESREAQD